MQPTPRSRTTFVYVAPFFLLKLIVGPGRRGQTRLTRSAPAVARALSSQVRHRARVRPLKSREPERRRGTTRRKAKESAQLLSSRGDAICTFPRPIGCIGFPESELARARGARSVAARLAHLDLLEFLAYGTSKACTSIIVIAANILSPHKSSSHSRRTARPLWSSYLGKTRGEDVWLERASRSREAWDTIMQRPAAAVG